MMRAFWRWLTGDRDDLMSTAWLKSQQRFASRVEFYGPAWRWPIRRGRLNVVRRRSAA